MFRHLVSCTLASQLAQGQGQGQGQGYSLAIASLYILDRSILARTKTGPIIPCMQLAHNYRPFPVDAESCTACSSRYCYIALTPHRCTNESYFGETALVWTVTEYRSSFKFSCGFQLSIYPMLTNQGSQEEYVCVLDLDMCIREMTLTIEVEFMTLFFIIYYNITIP